MEKNKNQIRDNHDSLLCDISKIVVRKGMKAATMDSIAAALSISKRTLYEIFDNKEEMIMQVLRYMHDQHKAGIKRIIEESDNVMEGALRVCEKQIEIMKQISVEFFHDMDETYRKLRKSSYDKSEKVLIRETALFLRTGVEQGVFRNDFNFEVIIKMIHIQMESLKRMEEFFDSDMKIDDVYSTMVMMFLRGIASDKGLRILDSLLQTSSIFNQGSPAYRNNANQ